MTEQTMTTPALHPTHRVPWAFIMRGTGGILGAAVLHVMAAPSVTQEAIWWAEAETPAPADWHNSGYWAPEKRPSIDKMRPVADAIAAGAATPLPEHMPQPTGITWTVEDDETRAISMAEAMIAYRLSQLQPWVDHRRPIAAVGSDARRA